ncbi:ABC transporter ATP-binding protein [Candidatus Giovannonibacteria bacterium]|nr:ABC transporter ATP-binding protein [Candidatus Giovannonibacteria bacterium]
MPPALEVKNLVKKYSNKTAVDNISFSVKRGEFFGFLGPNGAGKTSTISMITGTAKITSGEIKVFGHDVVASYREARKKIGISPQEFNVDIFACPRDILYFVAGYFGIPKKERLDRIDVVINELGLKDYADKKFQHLSGGYKRRVMLARAMIHDPDLLILDEPTSGVDVELRHDLWRILTDLNKKGKTIFLTTHYLEEAQRLCDRIGIIFNGKIVSLESKDELIKDGKSIEDHYLAQVSGQRNGGI